ncbi:MAG: ABC transporter ATP-binding protein [Methanomicrobiales archaeon]|nr:ABC transporter ATP-binding protein [Methanomicrobiales archaeon]
MSDSNSIEVRSVTKNFQGSRVLDGISFSVGKGEVFGFLGPNGAGKTTTLRILLGLLRPDSGEALVLGDSLDTADAVRKRVGVLFENNGLIDRFTARENLLYYGELYEVPDLGKRASELLEYVGLSDRGDDLVGIFSTGMKRKLGLARAILHKPEILFLDEPSSGLDPEGQKMVHDLIVGLSGQSMTIFLNSHNLDEVSRVCSKVAILHRGTIRAYDSIERLRAGSSGTDLEITLSDPALGDRAVAIITGTPGVTTTSQEHGHIKVTLSGTSGSPVLEALIKEGFGVEEAVRRKRTLEEIYLGVVREVGGMQDDSAPVADPGKGRAA